MGPRAGLHISEMRNVSCLSAGIRTPDDPSCSLVTICRLFLSLPVWRLYMQGHFILLGLTHSENDAITLLLKVGNYLPVSTVYKVACGGAVG